MILLFTNSEKRYSLYKRKDIVLVELYQNGFILQKQHKDAYRGVEGDNWYLDYLEIGIDFYDYYDNKFISPEIDDRYIEVCTDLDFLERYIKTSEFLDIPYRLLFCETDKKLPILSQDISFSKKFLGYDYAYPSATDYYSCVYEDIITRRIPQFWDIKLNENGLFSTIGELLEFAAHRDKLIDESKEYIYELGDYAIYRLFEATLTSGE